jgi:hypothetical protein
MSELKLDLDGLTLNEVELIEELTGKDIEALISMDVMSGKVAKVLVFVMRKRTEPAITLEECGNMSLAELTGFLGLAEDPKE